MNMKRFMNKKVVAIGLAAGITLGGAGAAFAFFTSGGSGSGTATVGSAANDLKITLTETGDLYPGGPLIAATVNVANPDSFTQGVTSVYPDTTTGDAVTGVTVDATHASNGCLASDFHFYGDGSTKDSALVVNIGNPYDLPANGNHNFTGAKVGMDDNGNQDACEGATITFNLVSN